MDYLIIFIVIVAIILVFLSRFYGLSIVFPTLLIILALIMCKLSSAIKIRKDKKEYGKIKDCIKNDKDENKK